MDETVCIKHRFCWKKQAFPYDWVGLLDPQPQFANQCPWEKLSDKDWERLLKKQPQLAEFRKTETAEE